MDALRGAERNGLGGDFFNFIPLATSLVPAAAGATAIRKGRLKKFKNQKANELAVKYPHKLTSEEQDEMIAIVSREQRNLVEEKNKAKGVKRANLNAQLKGYDEYLNDLRLVRDELLAKEKEAFSQLKQETPKPTPIEQTGKRDEVIESANVQNNQIDTTKPTPTNKPTNTLLYVGIGAIVLVGIIFLTRKKG